MKWQQKEKTLSKLILALLVVNIMLHNQQTVDGLPKYLRRSKCECNKAARSQNAKSAEGVDTCLLYTSPSPRDGLLSRMPSSA